MDGRASVPDSDGQHSRLNVMAGSVIGWLLVRHNLACICGECVSCAWPIRSHAQSRVERDLAERRQRQLGGGDL